MRLPTVLNIEGPVIIFGGGQVGLRKVEYLSNFTRDITVVGEEILPMPEHVTVKEVSLVESGIGEHLPGDTALVVSALSDRGLNTAIAGLCSEREILVNVVDDPDLSTLLFPALSMHGDLTIAVSTSGRCPFLAREVRKELDVVLAGKGVWLEVLAPVREELEGAVNKNEVLQKIYENEEVAELINSNNLEGAKGKAREIFNVHR